MNTALPGGRTPARFVADVALLVGLVGISIPFGLHELDTYDVNTYEILLAGLALIAALGIVYDLAVPQPQAWPFLVAAFVWSAQGAYAAMLPGAVIAARISLAMTFTGYACLAAGAWRVGALRRRSQ